MRVIERAGDCRPYAHRLVDWELLLACEPSAQRLAGDEWHDVKQQTVRFARIEERKKIRMLQIGRDANLAEEALDTEHGTELRIDHLERDVPRVPDVAGEIHGGHTAASDLAIDRVAAGERGAQLGGIVHARNYGRAIGRARVGRGASDSLTPRRAPRPQPRARYRPRRARRAPSYASALPPSASHARQDRRAAAP